MKSSQRPMDRHGSAVAVTFGLGLVVGAGLQAQTRGRSECGLGRSRSPPAYRRMAIGPDTAQPAVKPSRKGCHHEAFLSKAKDRARVPRPRRPPACRSSRGPAVDPPQREGAVGSKGTGTGTRARNDYRLGHRHLGASRRRAGCGSTATGKRDDQGWYHVPGFWSDRQTDRDRLSQERPSRGSTGRGHRRVARARTISTSRASFRPDGDGVAWRKGFWAKAQPGWSWVPAQWVRQPDGWVFQEGYWDRTLEDRGTLFTPSAGDSGNASGESGRQRRRLPAALAGLSRRITDCSTARFGRPNSYYDGYPGVSLRPVRCNYYGYASYGSLLAPTTATSTIRTSGPTATRTSRPTARARL